MIQLYLFVNAALYAALAVFCTVRLTQTARAIGFTELTAGGHSEYLVVYGGLQLGLALFYFAAGRDPEYFRIGILFSLLLYAPMVGYRLASLLIFRPHSIVTLGTTALEIFLLLWALVIWRML
ncbi:MAG: DUF4345 domain-containing protein [Opitutaceae bacterium]